MRHHKFTQRDVRDLGVFAASLCREFARLMWLALLFGNAFLVTRDGLFHRQRAGAFVGKTFHETSPLSVEA
jgi:hypothetical protein